MQKKTSETCVEITCGGNPEIESGITLTYWNSGHEQRRHEQENRKPGDYVNKYYEDLIAHDKDLREQLDWPVIAVLDDCRGTEGGVYVDRVQLEEFRREIQEMICEPLAICWRSNLIVSFTFRTARPSVAPMVR